MFQEKNQVLWNENISDSYYKIGLTCNKGYSDAQPGQFITLRFGDDIERLLRRPFSIHRLITKNDRIEGIELLYKVVGTCTQKLSDYKKGDIIDLLGPLGNGFVIPDNVRRILSWPEGSGLLRCFFWLLPCVVKKRLIFQNAGSLSAADQNMTFCARMIFFLWE